MKEKGVSHCEEANELVSWRHIKKRVWKEQIIKRGRDKSKRRE